MKLFLWEGPRLWDLLPNSQHSCLLTFRARCKVHRLTQTFVPWGNNLFFFFYSYVHTMFGSFLGGIIWEEISQTWCGGDVNVTAYLGLFSSNILLDKYFKCLTFISVWSFKMSQNGTYKSNWINYAKWKDKNLKYMLRTQIQIQHDGIMHWFKQLYFSHHSELNVVEI
jgi:hypothetical protein